MGSFKAQTAISCGRWGVRTWRGERGRGLSNRVQTVNWAQTQKRIPQVPRSFAPKKIILLCPRFFCASQEFTFLLLWKKDFQNSEESYWVYFLKSFHTCICKRQGNFLEDWEQTFRLCHILRWCALRFPVSDRHSSPQMLFTKNF